ncbi:hypothetical protein Hypma_001857 [Hypsizygus marmoreus]|uniref:Uncharacterized protein n=1 Tax=Hypsizygus marmoreus TaxID=39966 RepID=A0A369J9S6_HYPMA|nr:hypothetical protein Hypma_001857 [Hypsizygus marmoreus]
MPGLTRNGQTPPYPSRAAFFAVLRDYIGFSSSCFSLLEQLERVYGRFRAFAFTGDWFVPW